MKNFIFQFIIIWLPWKIRRVLLVSVLGFEIDSTAFIGKSIILAHYVKLDAYSRIHNFVLCKPIDRLMMHKDSGIASFTFITGFSNKNIKHFRNSPNRKCELILGQSAGITGKHFIDCNGGVYIGDFSTIAGLRSQILTHSIDVYKCIQDAKPVEIGKYCFVGTGVIILPGTKLPDYSILGAGSVLTKKFHEPCFLYGGNPTKPIKKLDFDNTMYFHREKHLVL